MRYPLAIFTAAAAALAAIIQSIVGDSEPKVDPDAAAEIPQITPRLVERFAMIGGTDAEIADRFLKDESEIRREYRDVLRSGRAAHHLAIRHFQFEAAKKLNATALTWLGRNCLGQSNSPTNPGEAEPRVIENASSDNQDEG